MLTTLSHITPILVGFVVGYVLRQAGIASDRDGSFILKLVFYVCVPALVLNSLASVEITHHLLIFSLLSGLLYVVGWVVGKLVVKQLSLPASQLPVFVIIAMGLNSIFALPYLQYLYGAEGISRYVAYDAVNTIILYSWTYSIAVRANPAHQGGNSVLLRKLAQSPPLYAIAAGLVINLCGWHLPDPILNTVTAFSAPTGFLVTLGIGIMLHINTEDLGISLRAIVVRTGTALAVGLAIIFAFGLSGVDRTAVLLFCCSPIAFSAATFSALENLDVAFAARTLSISLALGIGMTTLVALAFA